MSTRRRWFGPSRKDVWTQLTEALGGEYISSWRGDKVQVRHGEWTVTLDTYTVHAGKTYTTYTRMRAPFVNPDGFRFTIYRKSIFTGLATWLGAQDVAVGHPEFDEDFVIKSTHESRVRDLLASPRLRALLAAQPQVRLTVKDDEGWFGADFPDGVDELHFTALGVITDLDRLKQLYELFAETLDRLTSIGATYERDPGVTL